MTPGGLMDDERPSEEAGKAFQGHIVFGGAQAPARYDSVRLAERLGESSRDASRVVPDGGLPVDVDGAFSELLAQEAGICVKNRSHKEFRSDGEDFCIHALKYTIFFERNPRPPSSLKVALHSQQEVGII